MNAPQFPPQKAQLPKPDYPNRHGVRKPNAAARHQPGGSKPSAHLNSAIASINAYIGVEPDGADKATAKGIVAQLRSLSMKDSKDTGGSAKSMALGRV